MAICIIPLLITGFGSYNQSKSILSKKLTVTSAQTLSEINDGLSEYFNGFSNMLSMTANNYDFINVDEGENYKYVPGMLQGLKESNKDILDTYFGTASGKFARSPSTKVPAGYDATQRPWYKQALASRGQVIITPPYKDDVTGSTVVGIAKTVEKNGQVVGVVGMDCSLDTLASRMSTKKVGTTGYVFISDIDGKVISHPKKEVIGTDAAAKLSIWTKVKSEDNGFVEYDYNGEKKFGVYASNKLTGWKLVATLNQTELTSDTKTILQTTFLNNTYNGIDFNSYVIGIKQRYSS